MKKTPFVFKTIVVLYAGLAALALTLVGCSTTEQVPVPETVTFDYEGLPLTCIVWPGSHSEEGLECDWVAYAMTSEEATEEMKKLDQTKIVYNDELLECVTWSGSHSETGYSCNFETPKPE